MCVQHDARRSVLVDLLTVYGGGGKCIVFTQTKRDADEVSAAIANHMPTEVRGLRAPLPCCTLGCRCRRCRPSRLRCGLQATSDCRQPSLCSGWLPCSCTRTCCTCPHMPHGRQPVVAVAPLHYVQPLNLPASAPDAALVSESLTMYGDLRIQTAIRTRLSKIPASA